MKRNFSVYLFSSILLVTFSGVAGASDAPKTAADAPKTTAAERVSQLEAQPVLEAPKVVGAQEPIKAYFYDNRVEYYDSKLLKEIQKETKAAMVSKDGIAYTDIFLTRFRQSPGLYLVRRGWDATGNCHISTSLLEIDRISGSMGIDDATTHSCSGAPCSYCNPFDPNGVGCSCRFSGGTCNDTASAD
jgi:hypothetical protein